MSRIRTTLPPSSRMIMALNWSSVSSRPSVRIVSSVLAPSMLPLGSSTFSRASALFTSSGVMPKPAIFSGSSNSFILYFFSPQICTVLTPGMVCNRSLNWFVAMSVSSNSDRWSLWMVMLTMLPASASLFTVIGGSTSCGRVLSARLTRSRTSLAAASRSTSSSNSTVMLLRPSLLMLVSERMPAMPLMDSSSGSVTWLSMMSALAPV